MLLLKKYCNYNANSILESVIALCIISVCLYIAILVFAAVFTPKTSAKFYNGNNKMHEFFFLAQLRNDSIINENRNENLVISKEAVNEGLDKISIRYNDSTKSQFERSYYVQNNQE